MYAVIVYGVKYYYRKYCLYTCGNLNREQLFQPNYSTFGDLIEYESAGRLFWI